MTGRYSLLRGRGTSCKQVQLFFRTANAESERRTDTVCHMRSACGRREDQTGFGEVDDSMSGAKPGT